VRYWGSKYLVASGADPLWPAGEGKRIYAYLDKNYVDLENVLQTLASSSSRVLIYAPGIPMQIVKRYQSANFIFSADRVDQSKLAGQCDVGICHANHGTTSALLMAGIPLLLLPIHLEQFLTGVNIQKMGAGLVVNPDAPAKDYAKPLKRLLNEPEFASCAKKFAAKYSSESQQEQISKIADRCEELISCGCDSN
jgi:UDP:flavonoid glycosyltransferase YjiC (YdhE family)